MFDGFSGALGEGDLALVVGGGREVGNGCCSEDVVGEGLKGGASESAEGGV